MRNFAYLSRRLTLSETLTRHTEGNFPVAIRSFSRARRAHLDRRRCDRYPAWIHRIEHTGARDCLAANLCRDLPPIGEAQISLIPFPLPAPPRGGALVNQSGSWSISPICSQLAVFRREPTPRRTPVLQSAGFEARPIRPMLWRCERGILLGG